MIENECTELATGVAARSEHSHRHFIHPECIIMRHGRVNAIPSTGAVEHAPNLLS